MALDDNEIIERHTKRLAENLEYITKLSDEELIEICNAFDRKGLSNLPYRAAMDELGRRNPLNN